MPNTNDLLDDAIRAQDVSAVTALLEEDAGLANGPEGVITPPLQIAICITGNEAIVKLLLAHGANIESVCRDTGSTPLMYAIVFTKAHLIPLLASGGADLGNKAGGDSTPLELAEGLPRDELRNMGVTGTREQYQEIAVLLKSLGA